MDTAPQPTCALTNSGLIRCPWPSYHWPPEQAQTGVSYRRRLMASIKRLRFKPGSTWRSHVRKGDAVGRSWKPSCAGRIISGPRFRRPRPSGRLRQRCGRAPALHRAYVPVPCPSYRPPVAVQSTAAGCLIEPCPAPLRNKWGSYILFTLILIHTIHADSIAPFTLIL